MRFHKGNKLGAPSPAKRKKVYSKHPKNLYEHLLQSFILLLFYLRLIWKFIVKIPIATKKSEK